MAGILTDMESAETFKAYESYLLGQPAKAGTVLRQGAFLYIWKEKFETNGTVFANFLRNGGDHAGFRKQNSFCMP